uniref:NADH-ubiquinone oxidoreductase chain 6 n=1 Tax=Indonemoura nohirae TaxID=2498684 RepID=A0A5C0ATP6_9NEOP|nr:NADH dehydrogenase subunit 6 [Indonemoura nohirae]QEI04340.1 NADH dehydrogenase subunit 6 [Indonemoura nohirae]
MCQLIFIFFTISTSLIFIYMTHPLAMGLILLLQAIFISILTGTLTQSFWFSYVLCLVFLGGLLVLFIYVTSLASNEMFSLSVKTLTPLFMGFIGIFLMILILDSTLLTSGMMNFESLNIFQTAYYQEESTKSLTKLYNTPTSLITLMLVLYLFLTLIAVVKITKIEQGPLRQNN